MLHDTANFADAWINLGAARYRQGNIKAAIQAMHAALQADPGNQAAANLGGFLRLTGQVEAAETLLRDLLARHLEAAAAKLNLAADLLQEDRAAEAFALLQGPLPGEPHTRQHWLLQQSLALIKLGRLDQAHTVLQSLGALPMELQPLKQWRSMQICGVHYSAAALSPFVGKAGTAFMESILEPVVQRGTVMKPTGLHALSSPLSLPG